MTRIAENTQPITPLSTSACSPRRRPQRRATISPAIATLTNTSTVSIPDNHCGSS
jgi:hypothetical protein